MEKLFSKLTTLVGKLSKATLYIIIAVFAVIIVTISILKYLAKDNSMSITTDDKINITPTQITSIKNIGEWEFLSINDEELVDTIDKGFFGDKELVRIYYGTLRLGINLHEAEPGWIKTEGDSIAVTLPPIKLLDNDFIDEARTKSFFESGNWSNEDRAVLYKRAYTAMRKRCLNNSNIISAEGNASKQFYNMMRSMGFENVKIRFEHTKTK